MIDKATCGSVLVHFKKVRAEHRKSSRAASIMLSVSILDAILLSQLVRRPDTSVYFTC